MAPMATIMKRTKVRKIGDAGRLAQLERQEKMARAQLAIAEKHAQRVEYYSEQNHFAEKIRTAVRNAGT